MLSARQYCAHAARSTQHTAVAHFCRACKNLLLGKLLLDTSWCSQPQRQARVEREQVVRRPRGAASLSLQSNVSNQKRACVRGYYQRVCALCVYRWHVSATAQQKQTSIHSQAACSLRVRPPVLLVQSMYASTGRKRTCVLSVCVVCNSKGGVQENGSACVLAGLDIYYDMATDDLRH